MSLREKIEGMVQEAMDRSEHANYVADAILAAIRECVPEKQEQEAIINYERDIERYGFNDCREEMLKELEK